MDALRIKLKEEGKTDDEIHELLGNWFFIKQRKDVRRAQVSGPEASLKVQEVFEKFRGEKSVGGKGTRGLFLPDAFAKLPGIRDTIVEFVGGLDDETVMVFENVAKPGASTPIWNVSRGSGMPENYHRYNKSLHLYRYGKDIANAIYVWSLFRYSHRIKSRRLNRDILVRYTCC